MIEFSGQLLPLPKVAQKLSKPSNLRIHDTGAYPRDQQTTVGTALLMQAHQWQNNRPGRRGCAAGVSPWKIANLWESQVMGWELNFGVSFGRCFGVWTVFQKYPVNKNLPNTRYTRQFGRRKHENKKKNCGLNGWFLPFSPLAVSTQLPAPPQRCISGGTGWSRDVHPGHKRPWPPKQNETRTAR